MPTNTAPIEDNLPVEDHSPAEDRTPAEDPAMPAEDIGAKTTTQ